MYSSLTYAWVQPAPLPVSACDKMLPYGTPSGPVGVEICRTGYVTYNDIAAKIPIWSAYVMFDSMATGCEPRKNNFAPDTSLKPGFRAELKDYAKSGYDTGHMVNAADQAYSKETENQSFILTNMSPQTPGLNRGSWKLLETYVRAISLETDHKFLIYVGPIYSNKSKTIGPDKVVVPESFYKIIIDLNNSNQFAFIMTQTAKGNDLTQFQVTIDDVEKATGIRFGLSTNYDPSVKLPLYNVNYKELSDSKKESCK